MPDTRDLIERYNRAWNDHDVDAIVSMHAPGFVFHNYTTGERAEGDAAREHIETIFRNWPDIRFRTRRLEVRDDLAVNEWTATATRADGVRIEWDGVDLFPLENGLIKRKDVYSASTNARVLSAPAAEAL